MKFLQLIITIIILGLMAIGVVDAFNGEEEIDANYLLTVIATVGALGGVAFALYGWYSTKELPKMIHKELDKEIKKLDKKYQERLYIQQQAMQKMNAVYGINDTDQKILLLKEVIKLDPTMYNVYNTLAYEYWYNKKDLDTAEAYFKKDLEYHPDNYQTMSDLVFLYIDYGEWRLALITLKQSLSLKPDAWRDFDNDPRIKPLKEKMRTEYEDALNIGRMNPSQ